MQKIKHYLLLLLAIAPAAMQAQFTVTGTLTTANNQPITAAEVVLLATDNTAINSQLTDNKGFLN